MSTKKVIILGVMFLIFAYGIWPGMYIYKHDHDNLIRINRITGKTYILDKYGISPGSWRWQEFR